MQEAKQLKKIAGALDKMGGAVPVARDTSSEPRTTRQIRKASRPWLYRFRVYFLSSVGRSRAAALQRMQFPIMGLVGPNGGGKTAAGVSMCLIALASGRRVLSTVPLLDPATGAPHPLYVPWTHWDQLLDWWDGDVFADEILSIASSRGSASLDPRALTLLVQLRKRNARFWWTAPSYARADVVIREVTQAITECRGYYSAAGSEQVRRGVIQSWAPKRLFSWRTYDAVDFQEWTARRAESAPVLVSEWFHGVGSDVFKAYDTLAAVNVIAGVSDGGICDNCEGTVSGKRKACRCAVPKVRVLELSELRPDRELLPGEATPQELELVDDLEHDHAPVVFV